MCPFRKQAAITSALKYRSKTSSPASDKIDNVLFFTMRKVKHLCIVNVRLTAFFSILQVLPTRIFKFYGKLTIFIDRVLLRPTVRSEQNKKSSVALYYYFSLNWLCSLSMEVKSKLRSMLFLASSLALVWFEPMLCCMHQTTAVLLITMNQSAEL